VRATLLLCEAAQVADGKLNVLGAGWIEIATGPAAMAVAVLIQFPAAEANGGHHFELFLTDSEHQPVFVDTVNGSMPVEVRGDVNVELPEGFDKRLTLPWPIAINVPGLTLEAGKGYLWNLVIDGQSSTEWVLPFRTRPQPNGSESPSSPA
jgi:hypothetical protein